MKKFLWILLLATAAVVWSCKSELEEIQEEEAVEEEEFVPLPEDAGYVKGMTIVQFDDPTTALVTESLAAGSIITKSSEFDALAAQYGIKSIQPVFPEDECPPEYRERERAFGLRNFFYVEFDEQALPVTKAATEMSALPGIISAEPQPEVFINDSFNDPRLSSQWHYINKSYPGYDVNCLPVWNEFTTGDPSVIVSVVDQGVDLKHEDLEWNCLPGGVNGSRNFTDGSYNVEPMPHGTHVAGTIAAVNNNGKGVSGIAGGDFKKNRPGVKIMSCQFFGTKANGSSADAIRWGANHGAVISQNSWGYVVDINEDGKISADEMQRAKNLRIDSATKAAVDYFIKYAGCDNGGNQRDDSPMKGGIVIFSAGNDNILYGAPANYEKILAVGATDISGHKSSFSNYGDWVDICAPGSEILSTYPNDRYGNMSGTSMACPHVSGVAALVVSYCGGMGFTADMLWTKLVNGGKYNFVKTSTSTPIGPLVDAYGAILYGDTGEPGAIEDYSVSSESNNIQLTWNVTATSKGSSSYAAMMFASKDKNLLETMDPTHPGSGVIRASQLTSTLAIGESVTGVIPELEFETQYYVTVAAYSYDNGYSALAPIKSVTTGKNNPPFVTIDLDPIPARRNYEQWYIPFTYGDMDGHEVSVDYTPGSAADTLTPDVENGGYRISINGPLTAGGTYKGVIKVTDQYGLSESKEVTFTIIDNIAPVVKNGIDNQIFTKPGESKYFVISDLFYDEDGEPLSIDVKVSDKTAVHAINDGDNLVVTSLTYGVSEVIITATDARAESISISFGALTRDASVEVSVYPNPVIDYLYVSTGMEEMDTPITVYNSSGKAVFSQTLKTSAFSPAKIDVKDLAPGTYALVFTYSGKQYKNTVVKK